MMVGVVGLCWSHWWALSRWGTYSRHFEHRFPCCLPSCHLASQPPSTGSATPLSCAAASEQRNTASAPSCSGVVDSREGCFSPSSFALASSGIFLTGFGSSYYHWSPNDGTLFWDRLPMALVFMAILASTVEERVNAKAGAVLLWPLFAIRRFQPVAVALEWRFAALWLGAIFSVRRIAGDVPAASAEIHRHTLLDRCRGALCTREEPLLPPIPQDRSYHRSAVVRAYPFSPRLPHTDCSC
jgi:hypothetical protein